MVFCNNCQNDVEAESDHGFSCCVICGAVLEDVAFAEEVQFVKGGDGEGGVAGQMVGENGEVRGAARFSGGRFYSSSGEAHAQSLYRGRDELVHIVDHFNIRPREEAVESAHRLYKLAVQRGFTRGRSVRLVAASCLYIYCRLEKKPFMLIDFSDILQVNVFSLGGVFLQLLRLFSLEEQPTFTKIIDPALYTHRFADRLGFGKQAPVVANTALRLISSMKRDWMQTGRRPAGVCGAALLVAAQIHNFERTRQEIMEVVHVGYSTLEKRVREFALTDASHLTVTEFEERAADFEKEQQLVIEEKAKEGGANQNLLAACEHVDNQLADHFAGGMCKECFIHYLAASGGVMTGAADPPAWTRNKRKEVKAKVAQAKLAALPAPTEKIRYPEDAEGEGPDEPAKALETETVEQLEGPIEVQPKKKARTLASMRAEALLSAKGKGGGDPFGSGDGAGPSNNNGAGPSGSAGPSSGPAAGGGSGGGTPGTPPDVYAVNTPAIDEGIPSAQKAAAPTPDYTNDDDAEMEDASGAVGVSKDGMTPGQGGNETVGGDRAQAAGGEESGKENGKGSGKESEGASGEGPATRGNVLDNLAASMEGDSTASDGFEGLRRRSERLGVEDDAESGDEWSGRREEEREGVDEEEGVDDSGAIVAVQEEEEEEDTLSDLDDAEIEEYITNNEEEVELKRQIWEHMNHEWIQKQALKAAAAAADAADGKPKRSYNRKKKDAINADNATDATRQMLEQKKLSSKVNYNALQNVLGNLFEDDDPTEGADDWATANVKGRVTSELQAKAQEAAAAEMAATDKYAAMLEDSKKRAGGSLTGSFLDSLTTAKQREPRRMPGMRR